LAEILIKLEKAGLTRNESKVYYELLKKGELSANQISKNISLDRTLTYSLLNNLIDKGQISYIIKEKKKFFSTTNPENLLNSIKEKETIINDLIPLLNNIKILNEENNEIKIYEGKEGFRSLINLILKEKELLVQGATGWAYDLLYEMPRIVRDIENNNIKVKLIMNNSLKKTKISKIKNFQYKYVTIKSLSPTLIFGNYISIHTTTKEKPTIILIKNKEISQTFKNYFNLLWKLT